MYNRRSIIYKGYEEELSKANGKEEKRLMRGDSKEDFPGEGIFELE